MLRVLQKLVKDCMEENMMDIKRWLCFTQRIGSLKVIMMAKQWPLLVLLLTRELLNHCHGRDMCYPIIHIRK